MFIASTKIRLWLSSSYSLVVLVTIVCIGLYFLNLADSLAYRRVEIGDGEYWRLLTGNLLHTNVWHLIMNLAGLWVIVLLHHTHYRLLHFSLLFIACSLLQGLGLYLFYPGLIGYVGLSGMLHGLFTYGAIKDITVGLKSGYLLLLGVIIKVSYEQIYGASREVTEMIGARVATEAHLVGVVSGILIFLLVYAVRFLNKQCADTV
ncbi:rhomboid family GlyGly-CTERM serine protease [Shewanella psychrophila]|uniref:Rhomboid family GlyGly-CTERM serine protease n=2 Tax=Shewanella psychrophila TaxID=225848 RepID=A0A1S6HLD5_9GAMM|nr:rhomboid family GlyGly-CTERM serine protease [Shewanella psychrophila]